MNKEDIIDGAMYRLHATPEHILDTWCKHNLLIARIYDDGAIGFKDTYWGSGVYIYKFEDICDRISFEFDMNHAKEVAKREWQEYDDKDKTWIPIGGTSEQWVVDNRAEKSPEMIAYALELEIDRIHEDIESMKRSLEWKKEMLVEHISNVPTKETEYMKYLSTPKTTKELMAHFGAKKNAVWQIMRTLRLKKLAHRAWNGFWKITEDDDDVPPIPVTQLQTKYLEYLRTPHTTAEMVTHFGKTECAVQQVTRTLRLMEYVESVGTGSRKGGGGCWNIWKSTNEGTKTLEEQEQ